MLMTRYSVHYYILLQLSKIFVHTKLPIISYVRSHGSLFYSHHEAWPINDSEHETIINKAENGEKTNEP